MAEEMVSALAAVRTFRREAEAGLRELLAGGDVTQHQRAAHGFAWLAAKVAALEAVHDWLDAGGRTNPVDMLIGRLALAETVAQLVGGTPMSQNEIFRPADAGLGAAASALAKTCAGLLGPGDAAAERARLAEALAEGQWPTESFGDYELDAIRSQFRRFAEEEVLPHAHAWHLANALVPEETIRAIAGLGAFGISVPEEYGGLGLSKLVTCVVSEELSRGWIGAGSLLTRSEIAAELILRGGTEGQKEKWLPAIASGEALPTAVFTEPDFGSDLASVTTRAARDGEGGWVIDGAKSWITHASRSDLMTMLVRTDPAVSGHRGLSILLVPKPRGTESAPFGLPGMSGSEIEVLGYRGMREYALSFDNCRAPSDALLGEREGEGLKQLLQTFEAARIQTAARALGIARRTLEVGIDYALARRQFGRSIIEFPRIADKIAMAAVDFVMARELTYAAARARDLGRRCDIEAGMAKLLGAQAAWSNADVALQIHGGNGYALEFEISRLLCDARVLSIFEGTAEVQAQIIARGLLG